MAPREYGEKRIGNWLPDRFHREPVKLRFFSTDEARVILRKAERVSARRISGEVDWLRGWSVEGPL
jgi:hypothetical protein